MEKFSINPESPGNKPEGKQEKPRKAKPTPFEIEFERFFLEQEVGNKVTEIAKDQADLENIPTANIQFSERFKEKYLDMKLRLARASDLIECFVEASPDFTRKQFSQFLDKEISPIIPEYPLEKINEWAMNHRKTVKCAKELGKKSGGDIYRFVSGKYPEGDSDASCYGSNIIIFVDYQRDIESLSPSNPDRSVSGLALRCEYTAEDGVKASVPVVVIKLPDNIDIDKFTEIMEELRQQDIEEAFEESEERIGIDEDDDDIDEKIAQGRIEWEKEHPDLIKSYAELLLDTEWDNEPEMIQLAYTLRHELQHNKFNMMQKGYERQTFELSNGDVVAELLDTVFRDYYRDFANEALAYTAGQGSFKEHDMPEDSRSSRFDYLGGSDVEEYTEKDGKEKKSFYWYPEFDQKWVLGDIKKKIGAKNFKDWQVERLWKEREQKLLKTRDLFHEIQNFLSMSSKPIRRLFQAEPGENWPRLYHWLKNDKGLADKLRKAYDAI